MQAAMKSIADSMRQDRLTADMRLSPAVRVSRALAWGDADAVLLAQARSISIDQARRLFARQRQHGRRQSRCHEGLFA
jgi:hypothetical protein